MSISDESGWMIEAKIYGEPWWWCAVGIGAAYNHFTSDSYRGIRFSRKIDAERVISAMFSAADVIATEHAWDAFIKEPAPEKAWEKGGE